MLGQRNVCSMNRMLSSLGILLDKESRKCLTPRSVRSRNGPSHVMYKKYDNSMGWLITIVDSYVISAFNKYESYLIYIYSKYISFYFKFSSIFIVFILVFSSHAMIFIRNSPGELDRIGEVEK